MRDKILVFIYVANTLTYIMTPIFYFTFAAFYTEFINIRYTKLMALIAASFSLAYILTIEILFPVGYYSFHLRESTRMLPFHLWNTALILFSGLLAAISYQKEIRPSVKREKRIVFLAFILPITIFMLARYIFTYLRIEDTFSTIHIVIAVSLVLIMYFVIKQGLLGLRFNIEYYTSYSFRKSLSSSASMFNHSLKNDILKISLQVQNIKKHAASDIEILNSTASIDDLVNRLVTCIIKTNDAANSSLANLEENGIFSMVEEAIEDVQLFVSNKHINFSNTCDKTLEIKCDRTSICKLFENIFMNSIEAIKENGSIHISTKIYPKFVSVSIQDTGEGIPKEKINQVLRPYFSTRNNKHNFGLGLYYCNKTMESYSGSLDIESEPGKGTTVYLYFPATIIQKKYFSEVNVHG